MRQPDPPASGESYAYVFDFGNFFSTSHPGGDQTGVIAQNGYDVGFVLDTIAPETHKVDKLSRILRAGGQLIGILSESGGGGGGAIEFDYSTVDVAGDQILGHLQTRPDSQEWQYYYVTAGDANLM